MVSLAEVMFEAVYLSKISKQNMILWIESKQKRDAQQCDQSQNKQRHTFFKTLGIVRGATRDIERWMNTHE